MVSKLDILVKCITLLQRERELVEMSELNPSDTSKDLVKTIIDLYKEERKPLSGGDSTIIEDIKNVISEMLNSPESFDKHTLLQSLELILADKESLLKVIDKNLNTEMTAPGIKRSIVSLRNNLTNYYKEKEIAKVINRANYVLTTNRIEEPIQEFVSKLMANLETLITTTKAKDPGIVDEIDINDDSEMGNVLSKVKEQLTSDGRLKSGWKELNDMLGGGFRRGETVITSALQHNYKSGFIQSLFAQLCMYNKPKMTDENKKPLNLLISFEDDSDVISNFLYRYLYFAENGQVPNLEEVSPIDIAHYIKDRLSRTGYNVKILRVNPSEWTYKSLFNKIISYEAEGYEIHVVVVDYLSKLPTAGCDNTGPMGTAVRDLWDKCRQTFSSKGILFLSPHQLSTEAKQLKRNGIADKDLVKEIANKGYYEGSKQLDQVVDLEIYQNIAFINKKPHLTFQRGKRRYPEIIDEELKYFMLPFPYKAPIPPNLDFEGNYIGFSYNSGNQAQPATKDDEFDF